MSTPICHDNKSNYIMLKPPKYYISMSSSHGNTSKYRRSRWLRGGEDCVLESSHSAQSRLEQPMSLSRNNKHSKKYKDKQIIFRK
jgi:hypothetical protein